jgi:hypothetical protein
VQYEGGSPEPGRLWGVGATGILVSVFRYGCGIVRRDNELGQFVVFVLIECESEILGSAWDLDSVVLRDELRLVLGVGVTPAEQWGRKLVI